jgi:hypothetical protein
MEQLSDILKSLQESDMLVGSEFSNLSMDELGFENAISLMESASVDNEFDLVSSIFSIITTNYNTFIFKGLINKL